ncbi:MAG: SLBB domain-containing protein, partial [Prevotellaceae bacterium]|nr:SLBB domain-containing protein [Prevotellaceae bacterium]
MRKFAIMTAFILLNFSLYSQDLTLTNLKSVKVDNLTGQQIRDFQDKYTEEGYTLDQVEELALQNGMAAGEWRKLRARLAAQTVAEKRSEYSAVTTRGAAQQAQQMSVETSDGTRIYGSSLFNTSNLTFEPNLRLPTPLDYQLGPDDELVVDVFGYAEESMRAGVTPEGVIRLPKAGQIHVNGLTVEQAKKLIVNKLSMFISTISTGESYVSVTLGNIRSMKILVVGEAFRPGTYTLPSVSSVYNTLNACGGPNRNGSFREIKVIRNDRVIATVDIYDFLMTGEMKNNIRLQDRDVLKIEPFKKRIEFKGELKNTGYFEAKGNETLSDMMAYAGGFDINAYKDRVSIFRNTPKEKRIEDLGYSQFDQFVVEDGDVFVFSSLLDRFENRVQINGSVFRPGIYALSPGMTLRQLIEKADGLKEDAFLYRAIITREKDNKETELIPFSPSDVIQGKGDIPMKKEDVVYIASAIEMQENRNVSVYGAVKKPGSYKLHENMTIQDLIFLAGGVSEFAELRDVEIYRVEKDPEVLKLGEKIASGHKISINKNLDGLDFKLESHDIVVIRSISGFTETKQVMIEGEVMFPGNYIVLTNRDRVSDVIKRAGGLNLYAYPEGAFMIRKVETTLAEEKLENEVVENISSDMISKKQFIRADAILGIDLEKILKSPGSAYDMLLEDGDIIRIPRELQTVQVSGEVFLPSLVRYDRTFSFRDYIDNSGGFSPTSYKRKSYVVYANGTSKST